jgi:hypothetical protein
VPHPEEAIANAVEAVLPRVLQTILPDILSRIFETTESFDSPSPLSSPRPDRTLEPIITSECMSTLRTLLGNRVAASARRQLLKVYNDTLHRAYDLRCRADAELQDELEDAKYEVKTARDDSISDIQTEMEEKLREFKDITQETLVDITGQIETGYVDFMDKMDCIEKKREEVHSQIQKLFEEKLGEFKDIIQKMLTNVKGQVETVNGDFLKKMDRKKREMVHSARDSLLQDDRKQSTRTRSLKRKAGDRARRAASLPF